MRLVVLALFLTLAFISGCAVDSPAVPEPTYAPAPGYTPVKPPATTPASQPIQSPSYSSIFIPATVTRVIDGDTIEVAISGKTYTVRYIGIDTPETVHPDKPVQEYGIEASNKNKELVSGKTVSLEKDVSETDKYGRLLRYVYVGNLFINAELVRLGYAQVSTYPPDVEYQDLFLRLQREAQSAGRGLWGAAPATTAPTTSSSSGQFVGSKKSDKYHYPSCQWAKQILPQNEIWFSSVADAKAKGYVPCKVCKPPG